MDRKIDAKKYPVKSIMVSVIGVIGVVSIFMMLMDVSSGRSFTVDKGRLVISPVSSGIFEDFIPIRARVAPLNTVFLDAIEGGRVEKRWVENGAIVSEGQLIAELSNTSLQLDIMRNEAEVTQQLNNMRTIELQLERNRLSHKRNLLEIDYQIIKLTRQAKRQKLLVKQSSVAKSVLDETQDDLNYYIQLKSVTLDSQATDARLQEEQLAFLQENAKRLEENLIFARSNVDKLKIRAPITGKLSGFDIEVGQSIDRGGRLGQIDVPEQFKLSALIDEYYLGRVVVGQKVNFERDSTEYTLEIEKIYPQVQKGQFEIDMVFTSDFPSVIRRGQTIQTKLLLGDAQKALLIPNGAFYEHTGGNWIFVVSNDGKEATKRNISLGRRNTRFVEVLDGLDEGDNVITSAYTSYKDIDRLELEGDSLS